MVKNKINIVLKTCLSLLLAFYICSVPGCTKDDALKERELNLKEKELNIREKELDKKENSSILEEKENKRKLQYLFSSNGGLIGYFNDGSVASCPRCDLIRENVKSLYKQKPNGSFTVNNDGILTIKGSGKIDPKLKDGWVMINYEWLVSVE